MRAVPRGGTVVLRPGTYGARGTTTTLYRPGRRGEPTTFRGDPNAAAPTILGHVKVAASHQHLDRLLFDGPTGPAKQRTTDNPHGEQVLLSVYGPGVSRVSISNSEIRDSRWHAGIYVSGARRVVIAGNRIHDNGRLPATNNDHGIYVAKAKGTRIRNNAIYDNADRGIQLYPFARATTITGNVVDGNGQGLAFGGKGRLASKNSTVEENVITNSRIRYNVESYYGQGDAVGHRNLVRFNCIYGARAKYAGKSGAGIERPTRGFRVRRNVFADPQYVDRAGKDFSLSSGSPCRSLR